MHLPHVDAFLKCSESGRFQSVPKTIKLHSWEPLVNKFPPCQRMFVFIEWDSDKLDFHPKTSHIATVFLMSVWSPHLRAQLILMSIRFWGFFHAESPSGNSAAWTWSRVVSVGWNLMLPRTDSIQIPKVIQTQLFKATCVVLIVCCVWAWVYVCVCVCSHLYLAMCGHNLTAVQGAC